MTEDALAMKQADIRIELTKEAVHHWHGRGRAIHIPTGITVEFEESWNDKSGRKRALEELEQRVKRS